MKNSFFFLVLTGIVFFLMSYQSTAQAPTHHSGARISVEWDGINSHDSIQIKYWDRIFSEPYRYRVPHHTLASQSKDSSIFNIESLRESKYFSVVPLQNGAVENPYIRYGQMIVQPGDDIRIRVTKDTVTFEGEGQPSYDCQYALQSLSARLRKRYFANRGNYDSASFFPFIQARLEFESDLLQGRLKLLESYRSNLQKSTYFILKTDIISEYNYMTDLMYNNAASQSIDSKFKSTASRAGAQEKIRHLFEARKKPNLYGIPIEYASRSKHFLASLVEKAKVKMMSGDASDLYQILVSDYDGVLRDELIVCYFFESVKSVIARSHLKEAVDLVQDPACKAIIQSFDRAYSEGSDAWNFSLTDSNGKNVQLSDLKGNIVLIDFWFTGCMPCRLFYKDVLSVIEEKYRNVPGISFVSVNVDKDSGKWRKGILTQTYTSKEVINVSTSGQGEDHEVIRKFGVAFYPYALLIGRDGKIISAFQEDLRDFTRLNTLISKVLK